MEDQVITIGCDIDHHEPVVLETESTSLSTTGPPKSNTERIVDKMLQAREEVDRFHACVNSSTDVLSAVGPNFKLQLKRKTSSSAAEDDNKPRQNKKSKAKWQAKTKEAKKNGTTPHLTFDIPFTTLPPIIWTQIKRDFGIIQPDSTFESAEEEGLALIAILRAIGFQWTTSSADDSSSSLTLTQVPDPMSFERMRDLSML